MELHDNDKTDLFASDKKVLVSSSMRTLESATRQEEGQVIDTTPQAREALMRQVATFQLPPVTTQSLSKMFDHQ